MKTIFLVTLMIFSSSIMAQKQEKGSIPLELEFSPLGNTPLGISGLKGRYFLTEKSAFRFNLFLGGSSETTTTDVNDITLADVASTFDFSLRPGYEIHFAGTEKLSPYVGGEALFALNSTSNNAEQLNLNSEKVTTSASSGTISLGLNIVSGCDYYFAKKFYVGLELGFGFSTSLPSTVTTVAANGDRNTTTGNISSLNWGPNYIASIRIGYCLK